MDFLECLKRQPMSQTGRDRLRIRWILPAATDDDESALTSEVGPRCLAFKRWPFLCPAKSARNFMDHRCTWTTTVKSIAPESSFLSQPHLAMTYTARDCRQEALCVESRIGGGGQ